MAIGLAAPLTAAAQSDGETPVSPLEEGLEEKSAVEVPAPVTEEPALPPVPETDTPEVSVPAIPAAPEASLPLPEVSDEPTAEDTPEAVRVAEPLQSFEGLQVPFAQQSAVLEEPAKEGLLALADYMIREASLRVQLTAYASDTEPLSSYARRLSLSRALAVRAFLVDKGVAQTRIDLRPLGSESEHEAADFVDILPVRR